MADNYLESIKEFGSQMPGGFFIYQATGDGQILYANDIVFEIFGCDTLEEFKQLTGFTFAGLVHPDDLANVQASIQEQVKVSDHSLDFVEYRIIKKDGSICWVDDYGRMVDTKEYGPVYYVLIRDITALVNARKAHMEKLSMELALEKERHTNEVKSAFLFNISHDLRTPMNAIKGFTDLAQMYIDDPLHLKEYLNLVNESTTHLISLIDDLLEMSKLDFGHIEINPAPTDLGKTLSEAVDLFLAEAAKKNLTIETDFTLPERAVLADASRITRIMSNLLSNAVKFSHPDGRIMVSARQKQVSESGYARFEFTVADNGIGMSEDFIHKIYDAFEREESSTQTGYIGTGLGLTITKRLLDVMGGSIVVESQKGDGSTFTVDLPLKFADTPAAPDTLTREKPEAARAVGEHRILLVEDIMINRKLAEKVLTDAGFLVESVTDGSDAVEAMKSHEEWYYDLILMDIQMPVMNGYEATRSIRAMGRADSKLIPIIALSANAREEDRQMSMDSGMNSHVAKPFDIAHLIGTINDHLQSDDA